MRQAYSVAVPVPPLTYPSTHLQERQGFTPEQLAPIDISEPEVPRKEAPLPAWNGIGSPEDSMQVGAAGSGCRRVGSAGSWHCVRHM